MALIATFYFTLRIRQYIFAKIILQNALDL